MSGSVSGATFNFGRERNNLADVLTRDGLEGSDQPIHTPLESLVRKFSVVASAWCCTAVSASLSSRVDDVRVRRLTADVVSLVVAAAAAPLSSEGDRTFRYPRLDAGPATLPAADVGATGGLVEAGASV